MKKYVKDLDREISFIERLFNLNNNLIAEDGAPIIYNENGKFIFETNDKISRNNSKFRYENINGQCLNFKNLEIKVIESSIFSSGKTNKFNLRLFSSLTFDNSKELLYKFIIYNGNFSQIYFDNFFSNNYFLISINGQVFQGIEFNINDYNFQLYRLNDLFVIESLTLINFKLFDKYIRAILGSFGFITGVAPRERSFIFSYEEFNNEIKDFIYASNFGKTYNSRYTLISGNPYSYYQNIDLDFKFTKEDGFKQDKRIEELYKEFKHIDRNVFETLCIKIIESEQFSEILFGVLSVNQNINPCTILLQGASYSVLLEMITNLISDENKDKLYCIRDVKKRKDLQRKLDEKAEEFFRDNDLDNYPLSYIKSKILNINAPTNSDKLKAPFEILDLKLNKQEEEIIKYRNKFLHGENPYVNKEVEIQFKNLFYITLELNFLVNALILKYIGFRGIVRNLSKIYLDDKNIEYLENEEYFKRI